MRTVVKNSLSGLRLGEAVVFKNMAMIPLFDGPAAGFRYLSMKEALSKGFVEITEVSEGGSVPNLKVINHGDAPVLLIDGEELQGAKQNRIINTSILVAAKSETVIPVSCTERGRWRYSSRSFSESGFVMPARSRSSKSERIYQNLRRKGAYDAEQGLVWNEVYSYHSSLGTHSQSEALRDAYIQREQDFGSYLTAFPLQAGQQGMIVLLNGRPAGADYLSVPEVYADLHEKLIKSFAVEALIRPVQDVPTDNLAIDAYAFLHGLDGTEEQVFEPVGLGEDLRYDGEYSGGAALVHADSLVHFNVFPKAGAQDERQQRREESATGDVSLTDRIRRFF